jgi:nicotinamidase/pyrazinamidase
MKTEAFIVIDMLNDFVLEGAPLEVEGARDIIPSLEKRIEEARRRGIPVIYLCDSHAPDDPEFEVWPTHAVVGEEGAGVVDELEPHPDDFIVRKTTYSGFYKTKLEDLLKNLGIRKLTLTGVCTSICVLYTAVDAFMRGYEVQVPEDSVAGLTPEDHTFALRQIREVLVPRKDRM